MNKYNAKKTEIDGIVFDSKKEARYYEKLKADGKLFHRQVRYELLPPYRNGNNKAIRKMEYVADFVIVDENNKTLAVIDTKGFRTSDYKLKKKLFEHKYYPLTITEV